MLINLGILASSGSLVEVPNLLGLDKTIAATTITNVGLVPIDGGSTNTGTSSLNNTIATQSPAAGTLVEFGSQVTYTWFSYVAPPFFPPYFPPPFFPFFPPHFPPPCTPSCGEWTYINLISCTECSTFPESSDPSQGLRVCTYGARSRTCTASDCSTFTQTENNGPYEVVENCTIPIPPFFPPFFPFFPPFFPFFPPFFPGCTEFGCAGDCNCVSCWNSGGIWTGSACVF